jgi:predicted DNA-binding transcriptional regulator AlpA
MALQPRFIRARDAHGYCGMSRSLFNEVIRPTLIEIPIGRQGIAFDRLELDAALDDYKQRNGRPGRDGGRLWEENESPASLRGTGLGISTKSSTEGDFAKALERVTRQRRSRSSR